MSFFTRILYLDELSASENNSLQIPNTENVTFSCHLYRSQVVPERFQLYMRKNTFAKGLLCT